MESAAPAQLTFDPHAASVHLHESLAHRQPEPAPAPAPLGRAGLSELLEDVGEILGGNPHTRVCHGHDEFLAGARRSHGDPAYIGEA